MLTLFIANKNYSSWSLRPWLLMTQLGIPFEEQTHIFDGQLNWERFRQFAPNGRVPCLHDDGLVVWDSLAIIEYLAETSVAVWPQNRIARAWARSACAEMHSGFAALRGQCPMNIGIRLRLHQIDNKLHNDVARIDELWCEGLNRFGGPFLAGKDFSAVDAFFAPICFRYQSYQFVLSQRAQHYVDTMMQLPAMQQWQAAALIEKWRDASHDEEIIQSGTLLSDLRVST